MKSAERDFWISSFSGSSVSSSSCKSKQHEMNLKILPCHNNFTAEIKGRHWYTLYLCLSDELLFIDLTKTLFALFLIKNDSLLVFRHIFLGLLFPLYIVPRLKNAIKSKGVQWPYKINLISTLSLILCLMMSSSLWVVSSVMTGAEVSKHFYSDANIYKEGWQT
jgi:hypothetical protein